MLKFKKFSLKQLWILILLVPALIFIFRSLFGNLFVIKENNDFYSIKISDPRGNSFEINSDSHPYDVSNVIKLLSSAEPSGPINTEGASTVSLDISDKSGTRLSVILFFTMPNSAEDDITCTFFQGDKPYVAKKDCVEAFVSSEYAVSLYPYSYVPSLTTHSLDSVIPSDISWNYKCANGTFNKVSYVETTSQNQVYFQNGKMDFSFSVPPTSANISISNGDAIIYSGSLYELSKQNIDVSGRLYVSIDASWDNTSDKLYFGNASYDFTMEYMAPAQFSVVNNSVQAGGFIGMQGINISDHNKIKISTDPKLLVAPKVMSKGNSAFALIPVPFDTQSKNLVLTVSYGEITSSIPISVEPISPNDPVKITVDAEIVNKYHSEDSVTEFRQLLTSVCKGSGLSNALFSDFYNPEINIGTQLFLSAGEVYQVNGLYSSTSTENHYSMPYGAPVQTLSGGVIDNIGFCDHLGNYVVVDHGMGVRTWYSHLSEITVKKGDFVNKGDIIGRAGSSGYAFTCGVSVFCTIGYTTVSINEIIKNGIRFSE